MPTCTCNASDVIPQGSLRTVNAFDVGSTLTVYQSLFDF